MNNSEQFPHLQKSPIFADIPREDVRMFLDRCTSRIFRQKTVLLRESEAADGVYIVAHGSIDIYSTSYNGHRVLLHRAGQGEIVGELEAISQRLCTATCETGRNTTILTVPIALLMEYLKGDLFLRNVMSIFYNRLDRSNQFKVVDNCYPIRQRLSAYLLYLSGKSRVISDNQTFLAELIGCSRQTINRELGSLRDDGVLTIKGRKIEIVDLDLLRIYSGIKDEGPVRQTV